MQSPSSIPVAIIGMACRLPGADNLDEFWRLVVEGRNAVVELPPDRLDQELYYDSRVGQIGKTYSKLGAILRNRQFDAQACPIPTSLLNSVDSAHLLMCQTAAEALRHAGLDPFDVPLRNTGVYIGHAQGSTLGGDLTYASYAEEAAELLRQVDEFRALPAAQQDKTIARLVERIRGPLPKRTVQSADVACSLVAGVITQAFGLTGPYLALNSACASSLQSMLVAARALQLGRVDMAIAGGASDCKSDSLVLFAHARAMSSTGSRPFDAEADGLIVGEGYAAVVMKTLARALADGDRVLAVVRGLGVSSDGKGKSLWAPRKEGQTLAMQRAYRDGLDLGDLDYLEAHATATQLGDATELNTLSDVLADKLPPGKKVPITSVKANIGHTLETAGIAGVIKAILALQHDTIPPAASVTALNSKIDWDKSPVYVPLQPTAWPRHANGRPRRVGVNAFGIGGLNMHVAIEEFNDASRRLVPNSPPPAQDADAVAVIGMGCVWPGARGTEAFWNLLASGRDPKGPVPADRWRPELVRRPGPGRDLCIENPQGGFITDFVYDWQKHKIPPKQVAQADPLQFMLLDAADQAIKQSGYDTKAFDRTSVGVVVGTEFGGDFAFQLQLGLRLPELRRHIGQLLEADGVTSNQSAAVQQKYTKTLLNLWPALIDETGSFSTSSLASRTAKTWNLMGGAAAIDAGHGSALAALALSVDALLAGDCEMMLCAAGQRRLGLPEYEALALTGILATDAQRACPLDAQAGGYMPGEGVGVLLLKRLSAARRDGDTVQFVIRGVGAAHHAAADEAMTLALGRSLAPTQALADDVQVLEVDGAVAVDGQADNLAAIARAYGPRPSGPLRLSSAAGQIGHAEAAAGMASLQKASLEMSHHALPKPVGLAEPALAAGKTTVAAAVMADAPLPAIANRPLLAAVATRSRGVTYHAVIEAGETAMRPSIGQQRPQAIAAPATVASPAQVAKPAPVAAQPVIRAQSAAQAVSPAGQRPRIIFCFSGQGSQYAAMAQALVEHSPAAAEALRHADDVLARFGYPSFAEFAWGNAPGLGKNPWLTQLSLLVADSLYFAALQEQGIQPDEVLGHSYGEYPALVAAGAMDLETALVLTRARCDGVAAAKVAGGMMAISAGRADVERLIAQSGLPVSVANHNAPQQTVVGGTHEALAAFQTLLQNQRVSAQIIAVPAPFHTPLMKPVGGYFENHVAATNITAPRLPHWSVATNRQTTSGDEARRNLVSLLSAPVLYVDLIETVTAGRPCVLIEVGPGEVLTKLHRKIVARPDVVCLACDAPKASGAAGIAQVRETLERLGCFRPAAAASVATPQAAPRQQHTLLTFDATARRRQRMRQAAQGGSKRQAPVAAPASAPPAPVAPPAPPAPPKPTVVPPRVESPAVAPSAATAGPQLEKFLINFVVEQTGYPPEVVELDADLEADLGIDSIKKAQLFGELQEYFDVTPSADLTLDMFPTLRHVLDFLRTVPTKGDLAPAAADVPAAAQTTAAPTSGASAQELEKFLINFVVEQTGYPPEVVELDADLEADLGIDSIKKAQLFGELQEYFDVTPSADLTLDMFPTLRHVLDFLRTVPTKGDLAPAAADMPAAAQTTAAPTSGASAQELEKFLINFVVEQTGYPPEVVELDADLEADLGIDSIKKAQLFGELQEYFDVTPSADLTLDMFPTLRHVLDFLRTVPTKGDLAPVESDVPAAAPIAAAEVVAAPSADLDELEQFLINFVVEQTGYPPEVVELDADLEADLGIDSIKKAQLFGELQEYFDVTPSADLTLDMFPTLRHVLDFLRSVPRRGAAVEQTAAQTPATTVQPTPVAEALPEQTHDVPAAAVDAPSEPTRWTEPQAEPLIVSGTPYEMGRQHGQALRAEIRRILRLYADLAADARDELPGLVNSDDLQSHFSDEELDELQGIADGAGVLLDGVLWHNLAATVDLGAEHWQRAVPRRTGEGLVHLGAWSKPLLAPLEAAIGPTVFVRRPLLGAPHAVVALAGCVGALAGVNAWGLTVSGGAQAAASAADDHLARRECLRQVARLLERSADLAAATAALQAEPMSAAQFVLGHTQSLETAIVDGAGQPADIENEFAAAGGSGARPGSTFAETVRRCEARWLDQGARPHNGSAMFSPAAQTDAASAAVLTEDEPSAVTAVIECRGGEVWLQPGGGPSDASGPTATGPVAVGSLLGVGRPQTKRPEKNGTPTSRNGSNGNGRHKHPQGQAGAESLAAPPIAVPPTAVPPQLAPGQPAQMKERSQPKVWPTAPTLSANPLDARRFVMRTVVAPFADDAPAEPAWQGPAVIVGDHPAAAALAQRLRRSGVTVHQLDDCLPTEQATAQMEEIIRAGPAPHLFLMPRGAEGATLWDDAEFQRQFERQVRLPFFVTQAWATAAADQQWLDRSTVTALTSLGGELGFSQAVPAPLGGALSGLIKAICIEFHVLRELKNLRVKAIDAPPGESPESLADNIVRELAWRKLDYEVAFRQGQRYLQNATVAPLDEQRRLESIPSGVWVVSGGARGITAECALALAKTFPVKLHLLGTTSLERMEPEWRHLSEEGLKALKSRIMIAAQKSGQRPSDAWEGVSKALEIDQSLERYRRAGVSFTYHACDVSDAAALERVLNDIRRQDGPISGVLHGAGVERSCRFEKKTSAVVEATWGSKARGAYNLMRLTRHDPLRHFVGFGSVSGRLGGNGQVDYCAASDALAKLAGWLRSQRPDCHAVTFHWHPWDEVGMAARPETRGAFKLSDAPALMPKDQGLAHFLAELAYGDGRPEALVTSAEYFERYYGPGSADRRAEPSTVAPADAGPVEIAPVEGALVSQAAAADVGAVGHDARRRGLTLCDAPLAAPAARPQLFGAALVLGSGDMADAVAATLQQCGTTVQRLAPRDDLPALLKELDALWTAAPAQHLVLVADRDRATVSSAEACRQRSVSGILAPLVVAQRWQKKLRQLKPTTPAHFVAVTQLGGDFGIEQPIAAAEGGALSGLVKSVFVESARHAVADVRPKVIDLPVDVSPPEVQKVLHSELAAEPQWVEVAWSNGRRRTVQTLPRPLRLDAAWRPQPGQTWVITGGARGITAEVALEMGRRYGLKLHLVGASPPPPADAAWLSATPEQLGEVKRQLVQTEVAAGRSPEEAWLRIKNGREIATRLDRFRAAGVSATYHACDVADWAALDRTLAAIRRQDGPIAGIVHGAGYARAGRLEQKSQVQMERAIAAKFDGALALAALTRRDPVKHFITFGSISGRFGGNGLADYAAANEVLSKLAVKLRQDRPDCRTTCIAWQTWDGIGMATLSDGVAINRNNLDSQYISPAEGVAHFMAELDAGLPDAEVVISDGTFEHNFYGPQALAERTYPWPPKQLADAAHVAPADELPPLIDRFETIGPGAGRATIVFDPRIDPFLIDHKLRDTPFLPGVVAMSALAQAAQCVATQDIAAQNTARHVAGVAAPRCVVGLENVEIVQGIKFSSDLPVTAHVAVQAHDDALAASLTVEVRTRQGKLVEAARPCCTGRVLTSDRTPLIQSPPPGLPPQPWAPFTYPDVALLWHGPRLRALKQCWFDAAGGWVQIIAPDAAELAGPRRRSTGWPLPLAALDACVVACGSFIFLTYGGRLEVPHGFERLLLADQPQTGETCLLRFHLRSRQDRHSRFDFTLFGADGRALLDVVGYQTVLVAPQAPALSG